MKKNANEKEPSDDLPDLSGVRPSHVPRGAYPLPQGGWLYESKAGDRVKIGLVYRDSPDLQLLAKVLVEIEQRNRRRRL